VTDPAQPAITVAGGTAGAESADGNGERALIEGAIRGEHDALHQLWGRNRRWVAAIILAHKPRWADVEDLLQEVGVAIVRKVGELRDPAAFKPWLRTVAINAARAAARDKAGKFRRVGLMMEEEGGGTSGVLARVVGGEAETFGGRGEASEEARRLMELAMELPEGYREPLLLRCVRELSYRQIGELVGLPESTIETRIARGRRMLRELAMERSTGTPAPAPTRP
jgi:RNA polymerase sigma-70 factor (ECF subfamily)